MSCLPWTIDQDSAPCAALLRPSQTWLGHASGRAAVQSALKNFILEINILDPACIMIAHESTA